jgi:hypothetical protein
MGGSGRAARFADIVPAGNAVTSALATRSREWSGVGNRQREQNRVEIYQDLNKSPLTAEVHDGVNILEPFQIVTPKK